MPWDVQHLERQAQHIEALAMLQEMILLRNPPAIRGMPIHPKTGKPPLESTVATHVVVVMVRIENGHELQAFRVERSQHGFGLAGVDHQAVAAAVRTYQVSVVI